MSFGFCWWQPNCSQDGLVCWGPGDVPEVPAARQWRVRGRSPGWSGGAGPTQVMAVAWPHPLTGPGWGSCWSPCWSRQAARPGVDWEMTRCAGIRCAPAPVHAGEHTQWLPVPGPQELLSLCLPGAPALHERTHLQGQVLDYFASAGPSLQTPCPATHHTHGGPYRAHLCPHGQRIDQSVQVLRPRLLS